MPKRFQRRPTTDMEKDPQHILEAELLNRVILAKCIMAVCGNRSVTLRAKDEGEFVITPKIARGLMRLAKTKTHESKK